MERKRSDNESIQYGSAFKQLIVDVYDALKDGGLSVKGEPSDRIIISLEGIEKHIWLNIDISSNFADFHTVFTGTRISYGGYGISDLGEPYFRKYMKPKWDDEANRWEFDSDKLLAKTKEALECATREYNRRQEVIDEQAKFEAIVKASLPDYGIYAGKYKIKRLQVYYGGRVQITLPHGEIYLKTDDGASYAVQRIDFGLGTKSLSADAIKELIETLDQVLDWRKED